MVYFGAYLITINVISAVLCMLDKIKAKNNAWRIPEKTLFAVSALGGSVGMYFTMRVIRHKTRHKRFMIGLPLIMLLQCTILIGILYLSA